MTSLTGPELNVTRSRLLQVDGVSSTVLIDDGPRRWLFAVRWDDPLVRRLEELVEHAGFVDVAIDPSPVALSRVLIDSVMARRDAALGESFEVVLAGVPIAAVASDGVGRQPPELVTSSAPISLALFDGLTDPADLAAQIQQAATFGLDGLAPPAPMSSLDLAGVAHLSYPQHDIRSPQRQCVALGAAIGAAGLAGRLRPIDMMLPSVSGGHDRAAVGDRESVGRADEHRTETGQHGEARHAARPASPALMVAGTGRWLEVADTDRLDR